MQIIPEMILMDKVVKSIEKSFDGFMVRYVLYKRTEKSFEDGAPRPCYSLSVEKTDGKGSDRAYANDISSIGAEASKIFDLIVRNDVTPVSLWDVIEDNS